MKFKLLLLALGFSLFSASSYANIKNIKDAKSLPDKTIVMVSGKIIKMVDKDEFIIQDSSGQIQIEIDKETLTFKDISGSFETNGQGAVDFYNKYPSLVGATVVAQGILDNEMLETTKIDVTNIRIDSAPIADAFSLAVKGDFSKTQSIATAKSLKNKDYVLLYGTVAKISGDDDFILRDASGDTIKVDLEFRSKGEEIAFANEHFPSLTNSRILIEGFLDKEFMDKIKIDAVRVKILEKGSNDTFSGIPNQSAR